MINPANLGSVSWFVELIGRETLYYLLSTISSIKIDEHPMTASEFITTLVNGVQGNPGLSVYGFTVVNQEYEGVTIPLAYHTESKHFIAIVKATDYVYVNLEHIAPVAVNEALDSDYMYITAMHAGPTLVNVTIEHEDGITATAHLNPTLTYAEQGYDGYYSQNTYNSDIGESDTDFLVDDNYPEDGETIYDYCNDIAEDEPEEPSVISFTVDGESYKANEGDLWENWIDQETNGFSIGIDGNVINYDMNIVHDSSGNEVSLDDKIIDGESYSCWVD